MYKNRIFISAHTQNVELADHEKIFAEFDKKRIRLELMTAPLNNVISALVEKYLFSIGN